MAKIFAGDSGCRSIDVGGAVLPRQRGGFEVPDRHARQLADAIGGAVCGTRIDTGEPPAAPGPWCEHGERPYFCDEPACAARDLERQETP